MRKIFLTLLGFALALTLNAKVQTTKNSISIKQNIAAKTVNLTDGSGKLTIRINYSGGCTIDQLLLNGKNKLAPSGAFSAIKPNRELFSSRISGSQPGIRFTDKMLTFDNISFGDSALLVTEKWKFIPELNGIRWEIIRQYDRSGIVDDIAMPVWNFTNLSVWKGGILNNGGMVWCKYLNNRFDALGMHTNGATFWNPKSGDGLRIVSTVPTGDFIASKFFHGVADEFSFAQYVTSQELQPRYKLNRFVNGKADVFAPFLVSKESVNINILITPIDYNHEFPTGKLPGIDAAAVREIRNTTARYGVIDQNIMGGNGWTTNWKCLHEPFFAQIGLFVDDENYTRNFASTLDQERDLAMANDGRVLSRWHNEPGDEIPGTYNSKTGYYETQWGYTIDSQTGYVINTAEQFDLNGDLKWLKGHKNSCEKALDWLIKRDSNKNGLFEMMNDSYLEKKCSDWLDVIYASFENAFVNAQMYEALNQWVTCEKILGDHQNAERYSKIASRLKESFNKNFSDGGFWSPEKKCYIYWRDKDGTTHGDNLVTPISFEAIAFGICDDPVRIKEILDNIEARMAAENLFHWPLSFDSFKQDEVEKGNWPFPNYENGDIFTSWGYLGVKSYLKYNPEIALKYVKNMLDQYNKDGLSSQRFSRKTQIGIGSDILAGNCTTITALFKDIYGVRPKWNRMGLEPNLPPALNGTEFDYTLRGTKYKIALTENNFELQSKEFSITSKASFGAEMTKGRLLFFAGNGESASLSIKRSSKERIGLEVNKWNKLEPDWTISSPDNYSFVVSGLVPASKYGLKVNGKSENSYIADPSGELVFSYQCREKSTFQLIKKI